MFLLKSAQFYLCRSSIWCGQILILPFETMTFSKNYIKRQLFFMLCVLVYKLLLTAYYVIFSDDFNYYGVVLDPRDFLPITISWIAVTISAFFVDVRINKVSNSVHILLYLVSFVPVSVLYELNESMSGIFYYPLLFTFMAIGLQQLFFGRFNGFKSFSLPNRQFLSIIALISAFLLVIVIAHYGFSLKLPSLSDVYAQRRQFKSIETGKLTKYALGWLASVLNIAIILHGVIKRKYWLIGIGLLAALYFYSLGGQKSYLLSAPFTLFVMFLVKLLKRDFNIGLALILTTCILVLFVFDQFTTGDYTLASSLFVRRSLLLPAQIYFHYCEFFADHSLNFFSHSFPFSSFLSSPYSETAPVMIGREYFGFNEDVYANGNLFADMFQNAGFMGYLLISLILPLLYQAIDFVSRNKNILFTIPLLFMSTHVLVNTGLMVSLITHGILVSLLVVGFYPNIYSRVIKRTSK